MRAMVVLNADGLPIDVLLFPDNALRDIVEEVRWLLTGSTEATTAPVTVARDEKEMLRIAKEWKAGR